MRLIVALMGSGAAMQPGHLSHPCPWAVDTQLDQSPVWG
jgi:hypothetical protein